MKTQCKFKVFGILLIFALLLASTPTSVVYSQTGGEYTCGTFQRYDAGTRGFPAFVPDGSKNTWWIINTLDGNLLVTTTGEKIDPIANYGKSIWIWYPDFSSSGSLLSIGSYKWVSSCSAASNPTPTSDKNTRQIWFSVKGGMVHSITIRGTNQNNQTGTYSRTFSEGVSVVQTKERWKDFVAIDFSFKTTKTENGRCVIDTLNIKANSDYTMIQYDPIKRTCTGDSGNGASIQELDALAYAILHKDDLGIFEDIISKYGAYSCGAKFLKALASRDPKIIVKDLECPQQVVDYFLSLAPKYNKQVSVSTSSSTNSSQPKKAQISNEIYNAALRKSPGYSNKDDTDVLASIPAGSTIQILSGPKTADGLNWWQVSWNGVTGWIADHTGSGKTIMIFLP